ncbi:MAG: hypothetical protein WKG01_30800 [Kofleriaceae bacterium]
MKHALLALAIAILPVAAHADEAEDLKQQGLRAAQRNDWELARKRFAASYERDPRPLTLFNLASAEERTDKMFAARANFQKFLATTKPGEHDKFRGLATAAIEKLSRELPTVQIVLTGFGAGVTVKLDGVAVTALAAPIELDPGAHEVVATRDAAQVRRSITIDRSEREVIELTAPLPAVREPTPPIVVTQAPITPVREPSEPSVLSSPWFWTAAAGVVLGAAGGYYLFVHDRTADPTSGTLGGGVIDVR